MHKFINSEEIITTVTNEPDCDFIIASGAWGEGFLTHFFNNIQRNHVLCRSKVKNYEYVFYTTRADYEKYKDKFIDPDITFIFMDNHRHLGGMNGVQIDYAYKRGKPLIMFASDCLHTPNLMPSLLTKYVNYDACCVMAHRVYSELLPILKAKEEETSYDDVFNPRTLIKLYLPYLHVRERRYFTDSYRATGTYGSLMFPYWKDGALSGILVRSFHLGVIYVRKPVLGLSSGFLDSNPFLGVLASPDNIGMVTDSDDGFCIDVTFDPFSDGNDGVPVLTDLSQITRCWEGWKGLAVTAVNESLMGYNTAIHSESLNQDWIDLANKANDMVTRSYGGAIANKPLNWSFLP